MICSGDVVDLFFGLLNYQVKMKIRLVLSVELFIRDVALSFLKILFVLIAEYGFWVEAEVFCGKGDLFELDFRGSIDDL